MAFVRNMMLYNLYSCNISYLYISIHIYVYLYMHMNLLPGIDLGDLDARAPATASAFAVGRRTPSFRDGNGRERSTIQKKNKNQMDCRH